MNNTNYQILLDISQILYIVAAVAGAAAAFLWFKLKIPAVIGDLSGRTARKAIARTRAHNEKTGSKGFKTSATNAERGMLTGSMSVSEKKRNTKKLQQRKSAVSEQPETGLLRESNVQDATGMLISEETVALEQETAMLLDPDATAPLLSKQYTPVNRTGGKKIDLLEEVILIHTKEQIM